MSSANNIDMDRSKISFFVKSKELTHYHTIPTSNDPEEEVFENIFGKGENDADQHFLLFPKCFQLFMKQISMFESHLFCRLQRLNYDQTKILCFGKVGWLFWGLTPLQQLKSFNGGR